VTTLYDDYIWDGGYEKFGDMERWKEWKKRRDWEPAVPAHPNNNPYYPYEKKDDKSADDLFPQKTELQKKIEELEIRLEQSIRDARHEIEDQQKKLSEKITMLEGIIMSMQDRIEFLGEENKKLKDIVNEYNRFDIMDV
jgi:septal ring factor EnvC (AmiA/AmiB activator)